MEEICIYFESLMFSRLSWELRNVFPYKRQSRQKRHSSQPRSAIFVNSPLIKLCFSGLENYALQSYQLIEMISWAHWIGQCPPHFLNAYACQGCSQMVQLFPCLMLYECVAERRRKRVIFSILPIDGVFRAQLPLFELINYLLMSSVYYYSSLIWINGHNFVVQKNIVSSADCSRKRRYVGYPAVVDRWLFISR